MKRSFSQWVNYIMGDEIKTMTWHYNRPKKNQPQFPDTFINYCENCGLPQSYHATGEGCNHIIR